MSESDTPMVASQPSYEVPVGQAMPESYSYEATTEILTIGHGQWGKVPDAVMSYTVGGAPVIDGWIKRRLAKPQGRKTSPLDDIVPTVWESDWSNELTNLLRMLSNLIELESQQEDLLERIVSDDILTKADLASEGANWPTDESGHAPRLSVNVGLFGNPD